MSISILAVLLSAAHADVSLIDAVNSAREIKIKNPLVHQVTKVRNGVDPEYYTAFSRRNARSRADCRVDVGRMTRAVAAGLFQGVDGKEFGRVKFKGHLEGQTYYPPTHFDADMVPKKEIKFCWTAPARESRQEFRKCIEGHWDNWFDGNEPHRNWICTRYSETVESYHVFASWKMKPCHNAHLSGAVFTVRCDLNTKIAGDTVTLQDFHSSLQDAFEIH